MTTDANKDLIREHFRALDVGDGEAFASTHHPAGVNHAPAPFDLSEWPAEGKPFGPDQARETLGWLRGGLSELRVEIEGLIAEGDEVVAWVRMTGSVPATPAAAAGARVDFRHAHRFRIEDGLIAEHWAVRDDLRAMIQRGAVQPPGGLREPGAT